MLRKWCIVVKYARLIHAFHQPGRYFGSGSNLRVLKFVVRAALQWRDTLRWLLFVENSLLAQAPGNVKKDLVEKIHRPYARRGLSTAQRVSLLIDHYGALEAALPYAILAAIIAGERLPLAYLDGRDAGRRYLIAISRDRHFHQQGELAILLVDDLMKDPLATLAVNIGVKCSGQLTLFVNGLQGPAPPIGKTEVKEATRSLDGLRPKHAVLETACAFARWLRADAIVATCKRNHVSQIRGRRWRHIRADYDGFWAEFGAVAQADGNFQLPLAPPRRSVEQVPAKRRKSWLRRQVRLDTLGLDVTTALSILSILNAGVGASASQDSAALVPLPSR